MVYATNRANRRITREREMSKTIKRDVNGIVDYCLNQVEEIDGREDLDIEKRVKYGLAYLKEVRGYVALNLGYKKLMMQAPEIAKNNGIVLPIGTSAPKAVLIDDTADKDAAAG